MKRLLWPVLVLAVALGGVTFLSRSQNGSVTTTAVAQAQTPRGGAGGPFSQFREAHKYTFMLSRMVMDIGRLDAETTAKLTPSQAKSILAVLKPLRKKTSLTQNEAKDSIKKLKAILTAKQLTEMGKMKQPQHRRYSGGPGGPGAPGGARSSPGQRPHFDMSAMKNFNPFNPPKNSPMAGRSTKRLDALFAALDKKANGGHTPAKSVKKPTSSTKKPAKKK